MMILVTFLEQRTEITKTHLQCVCDEPISTSTSSPNQLFETNEGPDMATLDCQLDYTWNKLKPKWQGTPVRDIFVPN